jgi:RNA recognition motif-containing protein
MNTKLYVGNMPTEVTETELKDLFGKSGTVKSASIATDRQTGQQRGFAFIEMSTDEEAQAAITALNGRNVRGRELTVNVSKPKLAAGSSR